MLSLLLPLWGVASPPRGGLLEIPVIAGERWWGLVADGRVPLPFEGPIEIDGRKLPADTFRANMLLSSRGRYVVSREPMRVAYDGATLRLSPTRGERLTLHKGGRTLRESLLSSRQGTTHEVCEEWLFDAPIYSLRGEDALLLGEDDVLSFALMLGERGVPSGTLLLPLGWHSLTSSLGFDKGLYPSPKAMIDSLHRMGMRVMLTISPYVMAAGRDYQRYRREGVLLTDSSGEPLIFPSRLGQSASLALTEESVKRMNGALKGLQSDLGVDGFYFDTLDLLPLLRENPAVLGPFLDAWQRVGEGLEGVIYSSPTRSADGGVVYALSSARRCSWEELRGCVRRAIDGGLLGYPQSSLAADLDFGGGENLTLRAAQLSALLPVAIIPAEVWTLEGVESLCGLLEWRSENGDFLRSLVASCRARGEPLVRHLEYEFPRMGFVYCTDEYMIGSEWLVAPALGPGNRRVVRLPRGTWRQYGSERTFRGPRVVDISISEGGVALFRRVK